MVRFVVCAGLLILLSTTVLARGPEEGKAAPPLHAKLLDGNQFALADEAGKVVIVNLWATWCAPCRAEMPALQTYYQQHKAEGLELVAISMDEPKDEAKVREVMRAFSFPAALARDAQFKGYGRVWRLPLTFVIDRHGVLRKESWYGVPGLDVPLLEATVTPLLRAP
jgi:cytochrome c biogenesis protein CcmG/thiol:disulfide interchange protein DsbE